MIIPVSQSKYQELFNHYPSLGGGEWFQAAQKKALKHLIDAGYPNLKNESWKYTANKLKAVIDHSMNDVASAANTVDLDSLDIPFIEGCVNLVYVDGVLTHSAKTDASLFESGLLKPISEIIASDFEFADSVFAEEDDNALVNLNTAFLREGFCLHLSKNQSLEKPLHIIYVTTDASKEQCINFRKLFILEANAHARVMETYVSVGSEAYSNNHVSNYVIHADASLQMFRSQDESPNANHLHTGTYHLHKNSNLNDFFLSVGSQLTRNECRVFFEEEHGNCDFKGVNLTASKQHMDNYLPFTHKAKNCVSNQVYHAVLDDQSRSSFFGKVIVPKYASGTDSGQLNKVLLLADTAQADSRPELEIYNDDVKCHHGSAIGEMDKNALYYLMCRGISKSDATAILVSAFIESLFEDIELETIHNHLHT
ncbi:MAG: Fe-S cluster assembly protein SufD, partial [Rickettsiales bacterium]|nr:Fe-S cluster assembly protein SufD [Rickettsiales bacterium]